MISLTSSRLLAPLALCAALAGCADPRTRCEAEATRDLRTVEALIAETEANIARGYALARETDVRTGLEVCLAGDLVQFCSVNEPYVRERPVAIDRAEERRKLASLRERRAELQAPARAGLTRCAAQFPA
jgi:hypothetical protein